MRQSNKFLAFLSAGIFAFIIAGSALAQTDAASPAVESPAVAVEETSGAVAVESPIAPDVASPEAITDENVSEADLGIEKAGVLPDSPLYSLKRFGRQLRRAFIFDDAKKVEREILDANQELADLKRLLNEKGNQATDTVLRGFDRVEESFDRIAEKASAVAAKGEEARRAVMEKLLNSEVKRQKVFEKIESQSTDERVLERAVEVREHTLDRVGMMVASVPTDAELFDRVLENQPGSEFKDLRNLEVLKRLEEKLPEAARAGIKNAQENAFKRLRERVGDFQNNESRERLGEYMKDFGGDQVIRYEILNKLEENLQANGMPKNVSERVKQARDFSAQEFQNEFEKIGERVKDNDRLNRLKQQMLVRFGGEKKGEPENFDASFMDETSERLEMMAEFKANIRSGELAQEIEIVENNEISRFIEAFPDAKKDAEQAKQAMTDLRQAAAQGDFKKVKLLEKVLGDLKEQQLADPAKRAFMEQMEETRKEAERGFVEHLRQNAETAGNSFISDDPRQVEFLKKMKAEFIANPQAFGGEGADPNFFDRAIQKQSEHSTDEVRRRAELDVKREDVGGGDPFKDVCAGRDNCLRWCDEHKDDARCKIAGENERNFGPDTRSQNTAPGFDPEGFDPGPVGFDPGPVGKEPAGGQAAPGNLDESQNKLEQRGLIPIPSGKPQNDLERTGLIPIPSGKPQNDLEQRGLIPIPSGKPQNDLEKTGLIPLPSGKPTDGLEQRGLIPIPSGDTGPGGNRGPSPTPSPVSDAKAGGNEAEKIGLIPLPSGKPQNDLEQRGLIPIPSGKPTDSLGQRGLIPIPSGDTGPGGTRGPSPSPSPAPRR